MRIPDPFRALVMALALPGATFAQPLLYSSDATTAGGVSDEMLLRGSVGVPTGLPAAADLAACHLLPDGELLLVTSSTLALGGVLATPRDVLRRGLGGSWSIEVSGAAIGIPEGIAIDALTELDGELVLSFDASFALSGGSLLADEDLARRSGSSLVQVFDGSAEGVPSELDLDAAVWDEERGLLFVSFDSPGSIQSLTFGASTILAFDPDSGVWSVHLEPPLDAGIGVDALTRDPTLLFEDDFESGDTSRWSGVTP